jgi:hypothetical protein
MIERRAGARRVRETIAEAPHPPSPRFMASPGRCSAHPPSLPSSPRIFAKYVINR